MAEPFPREGLPLDEARRRVLDALTPLVGSERLPLAACLGRVSAERCQASEAVPGFRASIMDGYAISGEAPPPPGSQWRLVGLAAPGAPFTGELGPGEAVRILTGAPLPEMANRVVPQELISRDDATLLLSGEIGSNAWIRPPEGSGPRRGAAPPGSAAGPSRSGQAGQLWRGRAGGAPPAAGGAVDQRR